MKKVVAMMLVLVLLAATLVACAKPAASQEQADTTHGTDGRRQARCGGKEAWHYPERNKRRLWLQPEFRAAW